MDKMDFIHKSKAENYQDKNNHLLEDSDLEDIENLERKPVLSDSD